MRRPGYLLNVLVGASALLFAGARLVPGHEQSGPVLTAAASFVRGTPATPSGRTASPTDEVATVTRAALDAFTGAVRHLSRPQALENAFRSYFAYRTAHPPRGYVFDMDRLEVVDGPFTVAHGRGSSTSQYGVPTRFSNASGSNATSLGLYVAQAAYAFHGKTAGHPYSSTGLRLMGVSSGFNDNAFARRVVAHGAPYVTPTKAGRSEGCPAMEPERAARLLPKLADGGMVFLFAPDPSWMAQDPWLTASAE
jgi:hypothetical protein